MFKDLQLHEAALFSALIALPCLIVGIIIHIGLNKYCKKHLDTDVGARQKVFALTVIMLIIVSIGGLYLGNLLNTAFVFNTAVSHGMVPDADTGEYELSYEEILTYNKYSVKETEITLDELKGKAIIYVRYDCYDCVRLHEQLSAIDNVIFLSSQSKLGKEARNTYNIHLTDVPQGVYIDDNGNATTINIVDRGFDVITLNMQQITNLCEMADR